MVTIDDGRAIAHHLPRSCEVLVRDSFRCCSGRRLNIGFGYVGQDLDHGHCDRPFNATSWQSAMSMTLSSAPQGARFGVSRSATAVRSRRHVR